MLTIKRSWLSFIILVLSAFVLTNCNGGSSGGGNDNGGVISLSTVTALYPNNGSNWNDYVKNNGSDTACDGTETGGYTACLHGGEMRTVTVVGKTSCPGLTASDALGAFTWVCSASTGTVQFISAGLKDGKYLSDLLDFTTPGWKPNSVTVADGTKLYSTATSTTWWSNPVIVNNIGGSLATSGTIYAVTSSVTGTYSFDASKVALVSKPGVTIIGPGAGIDSYVIKADGSSTARDFVWFEGNVDATGDDTAVYLSTVRFASLRGVKAANANVGSWQTGILVYGCPNNKLTNITATNSSNGIWLNQAANNTLDSLIGTNNTNGVRLNNATGNTLTFLSVSNNSAAGVYLASSSTNTLASVTASHNAEGVWLDSSSNNNVLLSVSATNNTDNGVVLTTSGNNILSSITAANNSYYGVELVSSSNNALATVSAANNGFSGVLLSASSNNALTSITAANNGNSGVYLYSSSHNNSLTSVVATNNQYGVFLNASSNNALTAITASSNLLHGVYLSASTNNSLVSVATLNNEYYGVYLYDSSNNNTLASITAANNFGYGVMLASSSNNYFTGFLKAGNNWNGNCYVEGGTHPGIDDDNDPSDAGTDSTHLAQICVQEGSAYGGLSDFGLAETGITLASSFVGKVTTNDAVNTNDVNGTALFPADPATFDWTSFQNPFRGWGKDGSAFPNADNRGQCTTGNTCRIWDWSLASGDTVIKDVHSLPTGTNALTHTWSGSLTATFLRNATELIGNGNGLCESGETCLYTPNIGAYQGYGDLVSAGTITTGGTITNVTLMKYEIN